jgi:hypothetical protein
MLVEKLESNQTERKRFLHKVGMTVGMVGITVGVAE